MSKTLTKRVQSFIESSVGSPSGEDQLEQVRLLLRERCKKDFWFFAYHVLEFHDMKTALHVDMAERWQARRNARYSMWQVPRGHLKTSLWTEGGSLWDLIQDPHQRILIVNAKLENAIAMLANIKAYVEQRELFRWLFPEFCPDLAPADKRRQCKWLTDRADFPCSKYRGRKEGNIEVMAVEASLVSRHYDLFVYDDPVNDTNTTTRAYRNKIEQWYKNSLQLRHAPEDSRIRLIGTRWHYDDLYARIERAERKNREKQGEEGKKIKPRYWLYIRKVVEKVPEGKGQEIVGRKNVLPIWPERFSPAVIEETKEENGSYIFSCQYMNDPLPAEDAIFKHSQIHEVGFFDIPDELQTFIAVDMATDDKAESDYTAIVAASFDTEGKMYVREIVRERMLPSRVLEVVVSMTEKWNAARVAIEVQAFQKVVLKFYKQRCLDEGWHVPWVEMNRGTSKVKRFLALQPRVERGDFLVERGINHLDDMIDEMTTFSLDHLPPFDDILDCLADLDQIHYKAPKLMEIVPDRGTFDGYYGSLYDKSSNFGEDRSAGSLDIMVYEG